MRYPAPEFRTQAAVRRIRTVSVDGVPIPPGRCIGFDTAQGWADVVPDGPDGRPAHCPDTWEAVVERRRGVVTVTLDPEEGMP